MKAASVRLVLSVVIRFMLNSMMCGGVYGNTGKIQYTVNNYRVYQKVSW